MRGGEEGAREFQCRRQGGMESSLKQVQEAQGNKAPVQVRGGAQSKGEGEEQRNA